MIHTNRIVTVGEQESIIDRPIVLYRGDREVEIEFTLVGNEFTFSEEGNVIKSVNASHGQLVLNTPSGEHMFSELAECHEGKVVFIVTKEMIDEFIEMGFYSFQIRLYDSAEMKSRVTFPPVMNGFDIRNPIAAEDETNVVDQGIVDYARIFKDQSNEELPTFTWDGEYVKTEWVHHDVITENKLNKIEDALYSINANVKESDVVMLNALDNVKKDADAYVKEHMAEVEADVDEFERNLNTDVQKFKVDTNAAMTAHKNEVSEELEGFSEELEGFSTQLEQNTNDKNQIIVNVLNPPNGLEKPKYDGVTNDTEAIQNIINYVHENYNGGTVYLPSGDIKIFPTGEGVGDKTNPKRWGCLVLYDNITILGSGWSTRIIGNSDPGDNRYNEGTRAKGVFSFSHNVTGDNIPTMNCKISNLWIDGGCNGIMAGNVSNSTFSHLKVTNQSVDGIYHGFPGKGSACNPSNNVIEHCLFDGCDRQGISFLKGDNIVVRDCVIQNIKGEIGGPGASIDIEPEDVDYCKNILIENVRSTNCVIGLLVYGNQRNVHNITIRNCIIEGATSNDLTVEFADNIAIDNCKIIKGNHEDDTINFYKVNRLTMTNCTVDGCGIKFIVSNSEISNNIIKNSPTFGIQLNYVYAQFSSINNNVTGNKIIDTYGIPIYVYNATWSNITNNFILNANKSNSTKDEASYMYFGNLRYCNVSGNIMRSTDDVLPVNGVYCPNATYNYYNILSNNVISNVSGRHTKLYWGNSSSVNNVEVPSE